MNSVLMIGRLTKDPELRFVPDSGKAVANFTLAVNREFSKEKKADFFRIIVWGKQAENVATYVFKGKLVAVRGSLQTRNYENKEGITVYITEILADRVEFLEWGEKSKKETNKSSDGEEYDFSDFKSVEDEDVPF